MEYKRYIKNLRADKKFEKKLEKLQESRSQELIDLFSGKTITENLLFQTDSKIRGYFREKGFYSVDVTINRVKDTIMNNSEIFVIDIIYVAKSSIKISS